jgi:hypothetical protein
MLRLSPLPLANSGLEIHHLKRGVRGDVFDLISCNGACLPKSMRNFFSSAGPIPSFLQ